MAAQSRTGQTLQRVFIFDGTWADRNSPSYNTLLATLVDLIERSPNTEIYYIPGVGARSGVVEKYIGGGLATHQVKANIIEAISHLAINYCPDDEIVVLGYSRGAYTCRSFIGFLDRVGLPREKNRHILHDLYEKYTSGKFLKRGVPDHLKRKYKCQEVKINTLLCIDTVGSLGIPHTGIFGLFKTLKYFINKEQFMETNTASNVQVMLHALALHETRRPFKPTLMRIADNSDKILTQIWFPGSHGDVAHEDEMGCIADIVLAWIIANLEESAGIRFNESKLLDRFPNLGATRTPANKSCIHDPIRSPLKGLWRFMGGHTRELGRVVPDGARTNQFVHATVRLRGYGAKKNEPAVPGRECSQRSDGSYVWAKKRTGKQNQGQVGSPSPRVTQAILEAPLSPREAELLGIDCE